MTHVRSYLASRQPSNPWDDDQIRAAAMRAWRQHGWAMIKPDDLANDIERQFVVTIAEKLYGKRAQK